MVARCVSLPLRPALCRLCEAYAHWSERCTAVLRLEPIGAIGA